MSKTRGRRRKEKCFGNALFSRVRPQPLDPVQWMIPGL